MLSWISANMDTLGIVIVIILTAFSILRQRKPDVVNPDGTITPGGLNLDPIAMAEIAVRAARAMLGNNEERFEYAAGRLEEFFPGLDIDQIEALVEGAWDRVKQMDAGVLPGAVEMTLTEDGDEMPIQINGTGSASVSSFG